MPDVGLSRRERREQRQQPPLVHEHPVSLVASAANVKATNSFQNLRLGGTDWQQEGWAHYDSCPEYRAGVNIIAFNLSRARLYGVDVDPLTGVPGAEPTQDPIVAEIMRDFFGGATGQSQALDRLGRHLTVAGDAWCFATSDPDADDASWEILATTEVTGSQNRIMIQELNGTQREFVEGRELLIRVWRPHPKRRWEADAVTRSLLPVLREIASLSAAVSAAIKSRLASAGILWIPDDIQLPTPMTATAADDGQSRSQTMGAEGWLDLITEAMTAPIQDPDSAQAVVPLVAIAKADSISKISHMQFGRDLDATIEPLRTANLKRLAVGMDIPPSILLGLGDTNHWTSWSITEDFAKAYLSPLLELIVDAATAFYLRPALEKYGKNPSLFAMGFSLAALFPRQLSVDNAQAAYDAGLLSEVAYMEALGFSEAEMADPQERAVRLVETMVKRGIAATIAELGPTLQLLFPGIKVDAPIPPAQTPQAIAAPVPAPHVPTEPVPAPVRQAPPARPGPRDTSTTPPGGTGG